MTESANNAGIYSSKITNGNNSNACVFVNEVLESEKLEIIKCKPLSREHDAKPEHMFEKHIYCKNATVAYKKDAQGRRYPDVAFTLDIFLADESLVIPRYLIVVSSEELVVEDLD